jgi:uncharacterized phage protein gp47/JayE
MPLTVKDFDTLVSDQVESIQGAVPAFQFPIGSVNLALVESNAGLGLWMQGIATQVLALSRASSSTGADLDTWMAQFGFTRNSASAASGLVDLSRFVGVNAVYISAGAIVQTSVGHIQFEVYANPSDPNWVPTQNAYLLNAGDLLISVPVIALVAGSAGNVIANAIDQAASFIPVDTIANPSAFTNGKDAESDASYRARFVTWINSRSLGTLLAYQSAITDGTPAVFYKIAENINFSGSTQLGFVTVVIDDGSGAPPPSLITLISDKINTVRALGIQYGVYAVVVLTANITVDLSINPLASSSEVIQNVEDAISTYMATLQIGQTLIFTKLYQIIYSASTEIIEASNLLINGVGADLVPLFKERIYPGTITVSIV